MIAFADFERILCRTRKSKMIESPGCLKFFIFTMIGFSKNKRIWI